MLRTSFVISLLFFVAILKAQTSEIATYGIAYSLDYTLHPEEGNVTEYFMLLLNDKKSLFQSVNKMHQDTLYVKHWPDITNEVWLEMGDYRSNYPFYIEIDDDNVKFESYCAGDTLFYNEVLDFNWEIGDLEKEIAGYKCKNATVNYGGRTWTAWYAVDLPINAGPYKFKGLPGLILEVYDTGRTYSFSLYRFEVIKGVQVEIAKYTIPDDKSKILDTTRLAFNKLRRDYEFMTDAEKNTRLEQRGIVLVGGSNNNNEDLRDTNKVKIASNFIEID